MKRNHPPNAIIRANPFSEGTDLFCRLPLPTFFWLTIGFSPWAPDAVYCTDLERMECWPTQFSSDQPPDSNTPINWDAYSEPWPLSPTRSFPGVKIVSEGRNPPSSERQSTRWHGFALPPSLNPISPRWRNINLLPFRHICLLFFLVKKQPIDRITVWLRTD